MRLVLLPGMDGTGSLFRGFLDVLPPSTDVVVVSYPFHRALGYAELMEEVWAAIPRSGDYVLVAESFATPLAVMVAAEQPAGLKGVVLCGGFMTSPVRGTIRWLAERLKPILFQLPFPSLAIRMFLLGGRAPGELVEDVADAIARVSPNVLAMRLGEVLRVDTRREFAQVQVPVFALFSGDDRVVRGACKEEMLAIRPMQTATIDGPHLLLQRTPVLCARLMMDWIRAIDSQDASLRRREA